MTFLGGNDIVDGQAGMDTLRLWSSAAEFKISVFDLLTRNNSITRNVTETYVEDVQNSVLKKYLLFTFTYNLKKFGSKQEVKKPEDNK
jgi:hypothetical protein